MNWRKQIWFGFQWFILYVEKSNCGTIKIIFFHFESSFHSWYNPILNFQIFECDDTIKCQGMKHFLVNNLESKDSLVMKFRQFMLNYKKKLLKRSYEKGGLETSPRSFLTFKESIERNLRMPECSFGLISITLLLHTLCKYIASKFHFPMEVMLHYYQTQKSLELVFRPQFL